MSASSKLISMYRKMTPEESLKLGCELTEMCMKTNPKYQEELERRMKDSFILRK